MASKGGSSKSAPRQTAIQAANAARVTAKRAGTYNPTSTISLSQATQQGQAAGSMSFNPNAGGGYVSFGPAAPTAGTVKNNGKVTTTYKGATPPPTETIQNEGVNGESPAPSPGATESAQGETTPPSGAGTPQDLSTVVTPSGPVGGNKKTTAPSTRGAGSTAKNNMQQPGGGYVAYNAGQMQNIAATQEKLAQQGVSQAEQNVKLAAMFGGGSNEVFNQRYAAGKAVQAQQQAAANSIKETTTPITRESDDSPYWNKFGYTAVDQEKKHAGFINDRNTVLANSVVSKNTNVKYMTESERAKLITEEIIARQGSGIDKNIQSRYDNTVASINGLISRQVPVLKENDYFTMLLNGENPNGGEVSPNNPYLQAGARRYNLLNSYINMGEAGITNAVKNNTLLPGTTAWNDLITKGFGAVLTQAQATISSATDIQDLLISSVLGFDSTLSLSSQGTTIPLFEGLEGQISMAMISTMLTENVQTFAQYLLGDNEVQTARNTANGTVAQINTLNQQIADLGDSMKEMFVANGGTNQNDPFMIAYITEKGKPMIRQLDQLNAQYTNQAAMLTNATENARTQFEANQQAKTNKLAVYQFLLDRVNAQTSNAAAAAQQKFDNEIKLATLNKPISVGKNSGLWDPVSKTWLVAKGGSNGGVGSGIGGINNFADFAALMAKKNVMTKITSTGKYTTIDQDSFLKYAKQLWANAPTANNLAALAASIGVSTPKMKTLLGGTSTTETNNDGSGFWDTVGNVGNTLLDRRTGG